MNKNIYLRLSKIFDDIFDIKKIKLKKTTNAKDISNWDSINNLKLIIILEKEFKIKFDPNEIVEIKNVGELIKSIENKVKS
ncbi:MAG: acyl carrier protein [Pelagibacterales bacterium]|jgi:acyl carrier protein|nr:acyl carrier protein [Pelagibacterales bacterium]|tara:strand:+ start:3660 stop:3902 length:243 start_codon:yes stop_codon:yes gene_type:complete